MGEPPLPWPSLLESLQPLERWYLLRFLRARLSIKPEKFLNINALNMVFQLILEKKIKTKGVLRPLEPEVYVPGISNIFVSSASMMYK